MPMITPAISVLSALEGLKQVNPDLAPYVLPATIVILVLLFAAQSRGTARVAAFFSPIMLVFFAVNAVLGLVHIASDHGVFCRRSVRSRGLVSSTPTGPSDSSCSAASFWR